MKKSKYKADALLLLFFVCVFLAAFLVRTLSYANRGELVRVMADNELYGEYSLYENRTVEIESREGENTLCIENGQAWISFADCPNHYCMKQGKINRPGESLVCLPHKVIVEIVEKGNR